MLYLVDGSGFIFRAFHALPPLTRRDGTPMGAAYGFANMMLKLLGDERATHWLVFFDASSKTFRNELYADYKANRTAPPPELVPQFGFVREIVDAFGVPRLEALGFEADDLIASWVRAGRAAGMAVRIVSSDKDLMQLVDDRAPSCALIDTMKDRVFDEAAVKEKFGVGPASVADVLALMGDSVDNIPGVPGVGAKTASALIAYFGSIDAMYARLDEIAQVPGLRGARNIADKLTAHRADAELSRRLVSLREDLPVLDEAHGGRSIASLERHALDDAARDRLAEALTRFEMTRLLDRLRAVERQAGLAAPASAATPEPPPPTAAAHKRELGQVAPEILLDHAALGAWAKRADDGGAFALAIVRLGGARAGTLVGLGLYHDAAGPAYLPLGHRYLGAPRQLTPGSALALLQPLLDARGKHVADAKEAEMTLHAAGASLGPVACDPLLAAFLLDASLPPELGALSLRYLEQPLAGFEGVVGSGRHAVGVDQAEVPRLAPLAAQQAEAAWALGELLGAAVRSQGLGRLLDDIELPLARVLAHMEETGVLVDPAPLAVMGGELETRMVALEASVKKIAGYDINLGSPKQLQELLFDRLQLPPSKKTKTGFSVDAEVLEELAPLHPVAAQIAEHRQLHKLKSTYVDVLPSLLDAMDGRLHTSYRQTMAATGRLSSADPNVQNIPIRKELGREIRRAFIASPGMLLVVGDYSQIELRVLAHLSGDPVLCDAFRRGEDIHRRTVIEMFGADKADDDGLRRVAKMINYGIIYGLSDYGLSMRLDIDRAEARAYIDGYMRTYRALERYMDDLVQRAHSVGGARTLLGRFRPLPDLASRNRQARAAAERMARNTPVQGTAADILKLAMVVVERELCQADVRMLLTVHDELVLEAPEAMAPEVGRRMKAMMEAVLPLDVPLVVDLGLGANWAAAK